MKGIAESGGRAQVGGTMRALVARLVSEARDARVDGEEGPGADAWEHYKYWAQEDYSLGYYPYAVAFHGLAEAIVAGLDRNDLLAAWNETPAGRAGRRKGVVDPPSDAVVTDRVVGELMRRFASRAMREAVTDQPWHTRFGVMEGYGFPVFVEILNKPRRGLVEVQGYSVATGPEGERGQVYLDGIVKDLSEAEFKAARARGWTLPKD